MLELILTFLKIGALPSAGGDDPFMEQPSIPLDG